MSLTDKLILIQTEKENIRQAINAKGVPVATTDPLSAYAGKIGLIDGGETEWAINILQSVPANLVLPSGITSIRSYAFYGAGISSVTISEGVNTIGSYAFYNNGGLSVINLPSTIQTIGSYAFANDSLATINKTINWPSSLRTIKSMAFNNSSCSTVDITSSALTIEGQNALPRCSTLRLTSTGEIVFANSNSTLFSSNTLATLELSGNMSITGFLFYQKTAIINITLGEGIREIGGQAFGETRFTSITIPSTVTSIANSAFANNTRLTSITVNRPAGSITGAPWGATNATVTWAD